MELDFAYRPGEALPASAHRRLADAGPVLWSEGFAGWLVSSYDAVKTVLTDLTRFTSEGTPIAATFGAEAMLVKDSDLHHQLRRVWSGHVSRAAMAARMAGLDAHAAGLVAELAQRIGAGEAVDLVPVLKTYILAFISESFGIPPARLEPFLRWNELSAATPALALEEGSDAWAAHHAVKREVLDFIDGEIADRRARLAAGEDARDFVSLMVAAEGGPISRAMVIDNLLNFILGAMDTTEKWIGNVVVHLAGDPALADRLRADRAAIEPVLDEVMRIETVAQVIMRRVRAETAELCGATLRAGDPVFLMLGAANRDPAAYADPDSFDLARPPKPHLGFGFGFHHCLGISIARQEAISFVRALLQGLPGWRIAAIDYGPSWALRGPVRLELAG